MNWIPLSNEAQLQSLLQQSADKPQVIFKHSNRCGISSMARGRLERAAAPGTVDFHMLDVIQHRSLSRQVADLLKVEHESPQVLLIKNGQCVFDASHTAISMDDIVENSAAA